MPERSNRREKIIQVASRLFLENGYSATSVRQIAEAVGCTEAALYYHFRDGKRELLRAVVERNVPDLRLVVEQCQAAQSLHELVERFWCGTFRQIDTRTLTQIRWLVAEFPKLTEDERDMLYEWHRDMVESLADVVSKFVPDRQKARYFTLVMLFVNFGYGQLMIHLDLQSRFDIDVDAFLQYAATLLSGGHHVSKGT